MSFVGCADAPRLGTVAIAYEIDDCCALSARTKGNGNRRNDPYAAVHSLRFARMRCRSMPESDLAGTLRRPLVRLFGEELRDELAQPTAARIVIRLAVPVLLELDARRVAEGRQHRPDIGPRAREEHAHRMGNR